MNVDFYMKHNDKESNLYCFWSLRGFETKQQQKEVAEITLAVILLPLNLVKLPHVLPCTGFNPAVKIMNKMAKNGRAILAISS